VVVSKWALSSSSSKSLGRHSSGSLDEGHLSSSTVSDLGHIKELVKLVKDLLG
jgi:hypothetical protein